MLWNIVLLVSLRQEMRSNKLWTSRQVLTALTNLFLSTGLLVVQQELHGSYHLFTDGVEQSVPDIHVEAEEQLDDLQVLILNGYEQRRAPQGIDAIDVDLEVDLRLLQR